MVLQRLTLGNNNFTGTLPLGWGNASYALPGLQMLDADYAGLSGPLPAWGTGLQSLQFL